MGSSLPPGCSAPTHCSAQASASLFSPLPPNVLLATLSSFKLQLKLIFSETPSLTFCPHCPPLTPVLTCGTICCFASIALFSGLSTTSHTKAGAMCILSTSRHPPDSKCFITSQGLNQPSRPGLCDSGEVSRLLWALSFQCSWLVMDFSSLEAQTGLSPAVYLPLWPVSSD